MSFRRKLLAVMSLTVLAAVGVIAYFVSVRTRQAFQRADEERTATIVAQFQHEFEYRGEDLARRVEGIAASEAVSKLAVDINRGGEYGAYVEDARQLAKSHQLEFLELVAADGTIISSAQWPARFGYKETALIAGNPPQQPFLKIEELPNGNALGLFAVHAVQLGDKPVYVMGGEKLDQDFLSGLTLPGGMRAMLYRNLGGAISPVSVLSNAGPVQNAQKLTPLIDQVQQEGRELNGIVYWSSDPLDSESVHAMPLKGNDGSLLGVLLVGAPRRGWIELQRHIRETALLVAGSGVFIAILLSGWIAARVTRPIDRLAEASRDVAAGIWSTQVEVTSTDELGELATAFNKMTSKLAEQREQLLQAERVAAWRELARRLAHELKNPLFPLQITVENLVRAREANPNEFDEIFRESTSTMLAEIANLKSIIGRFSDFSKMPKPQLQRVRLNELVQQVARLHEPQLRAEGRPPITAILDTDERLEEIDADPELLHRVLSNLVLNAVDAMPNGGTVTIRTRSRGDRALIEISDTGTGLTREECERLFTPYYTTKQHGTGLGLAIVQSVISDHHGKIAVESARGRGTTFRIELPTYQAQPVEPPPLFQSVGR